MEQQIGEQSNRPPRAEFKSATIREQVAKPAIVLWILLSGMSIAAFMVGLPIRLNELLNPSPEVAAALQGAGVPRWMWVAGLGFSELLLALVFALIGISLFLQQPRNKAVYVVTLFLVTYGTTVMNVVDALVGEYPQVSLLVNILRAVGWSTTLLGLLVFPSGKFVPRWTVWVFAGWLVYNFSWLVHPAFSLNPTRPDAVSNPALFGLVNGALLFGLWTQYYRYKHNATPKERQQTKWVLFGISVMLFFTFLVEFPALISPALLSLETSAGVYYTILFDSVFVLSALAVPVSIAFSVQQRRLWKIDYVINRSLVNGGAIVLVMALYIGLYKLMHSFFEAVFYAYHDYLAIIIGMLAVLALFPLQRRIQSWVDRKVYGIEVDYKAGQHAHLSGRRASYQRGDNIGPYRVDKRIYHGQTAEVYCGGSPSIRTKVAIKMMLPNLPDQTIFTRQFVHEAQTLTRLDHKNIVRFYDFGEKNDLNYIVTEYISDLTLADYIKKEKINFGAATYILCRVAEALEYAHNLGVYHHDVKPENILLRTKNGSAYLPEPVLVDFGVAYNRANGTHPLANKINGTFGYLAPEQIRLTQDLDGRADIYALGVLAFELLTGKRPFCPANPAELLIAHLNQPPPNPLAFNPELPDRVAFSILRALSKQPEDRFPTPSAFAQSIS